MGFWNQVLNVINNVVSFGLKTIGIPASPHTISEYEESIFNSKKKFKSVVKKYLDPTNPDVLSNYIKTGINLVANSMDVPGLGKIAEKAYGAIVKTQDSRIKSAEDYFGQKWDTLSLETQNIWNKDWDLLHGPKRQVENVGPMLDFENAIAKKKQDHSVRIKLYHLNVLHSTSQLLSKV